MQGIVLGGTMGAKQFRIMILPLNEIYPVKQIELRLNSTLGTFCVVAQST